MDNHFSVALLYYLKYIVIITEYGVLTYHTLFTYTRQKLKDPYVEFI